MSRSVNYLRSIGLDDDNSFSHSIRQFEELLEKNKNAVMEEAVPAEMMEMFTDEQWPALLFEFQPGTATMTADWDVVSFHAEFERGRKPMTAEHKFERTAYWLVAKDQQGQFVRAMDALEFRAFSLLQQQTQFFEAAQDLWPDRDQESQMSAMTSMVLIWLEEQLIIDAGVPIPEDAEFEQTGIDE